MCAQKPKVVVQSLICMLYYYCEIRQVERNTEYIIPVCIICIFANDEAHYLVAISFVGSIEWGFTAQARGGVHAHLPGWSPCSLELTTQHVYSPCYRENQAGNPPEAVCSLARYTARWHYCRLRTIRSSACVRIYIGVCVGCTRYLVSCVSTVCHLV